MITGRRWRVVEHTIACTVSCHDQGSQGHSNYKQFRPDVRPHHTPLRVAGRRFYIGEYHSPVHYPVLLGRVTAGSARCRCPDRRTEGMVYHLELSPVVRQDYVNL